MSEPRGRSSFDMVVIGVSSGGLNALEVLLPGLPADFPIPVAVAQHRSAESDVGLLGAILQRRAHLRIIEPSDKEPIVAGAVYLAPPDYHLLVEDEAFALSTEGPVSYARPSVDVLFQSASIRYGAGTIGVVLTGANRDGADGARTIKSRGGFLVVEDPETAECPAMPAACLQAVAADAVLPLSEIAPKLVSLAQLGRNGPFEDPGSEERQYAADR